MHRVSAWRSLSRLQRRLLLTAWLLFPVLIVTLRLRGYRWLQTWLIRISPEPSQFGADAHAVSNVTEETARSVEIAARYALLNANCLSRSMMLWWLLRRRGVATELRIGVRKRDGRFEAHAWIELEGRVLNDAPDVKTRFASFDGDMATMSQFR